MEKSMKKAILMVLLVLFSFSLVHADDSKAAPQDVYDLVLKAYDVVQALGEESFPAFNDPKGEFVYKDTYVLIQRCPSEMVAHPFALAKLKGVDLNKTLSFNKALCDCGEKPGGSWGEYYWPKPGETEPSRKISYSLRVDGTPYTVMAGIYSDTEKVEDLNKTLR
jgi:cytochrome c